MHVPPGRYKYIGGGINEVYHKNDGKRMQVRVRFCKTKMITIMFQEPSNPLDVSTFTTKSIL